MWPEIGENDNAFLLPQLTKKIIRNLNNIDNFSIRFNRVLLWENKKISLLPNNVSPSRWNPDFGDLNYNMILNRQKNAIKAQTGSDPIEVVLKQNWRLAIGLGNSSVLNNGFTLHHIYGIPYIPGSAIKGVLRNYIIEEYFHNDEYQALADHGFRKVFGAAKSDISRIEIQGKVNFYDAFPSILPPYCIQPDVVGAHVHDANNIEEAISDTLPVNPIPFLTVKEATFTFYYAICSKDNATIINISELKDGQGKVIREGMVSKFEGKTTKEIVSEHFENAMRLNGIGAKTGVGYGRFI